MKIEEYEVKLQELPAIRAEIGIAQNKYHQFTIDNHNLEVVRHVKMIGEEKGGLERDLVAAAWLHDIGKPMVATPIGENDPPTHDPQGNPYHLFRGHDEVGAYAIEKMSPDFFTKLGLDQKIIIGVVYNHELFMKNIKRMRKVGDFEGFRRVYGNLAGELGAFPSQVRQYLLDLFKADTLGQGDEAFRAKGKDCDERLMIQKILVTLDQSSLKAIYDFERSR